ncbi:MAG: Hsp70 family protein [Deltaproteobacteria bacterium]|nr:Hsp70 family protein [Deltaproteobacteria bacterium]
MSIAIGVDIGTAGASVAVFRQGRAEVIADGSGLRRTPAAVALSGGVVRVGQGAMSRLAGEPSTTVRAPKRLLGGPPVLLGKEQHSPARLVGLLVGQMVATAEAVTAERPLGMVLAAPVWFGPEQRQALAEAGRQAGVEVLALVLDPTAVAIRQCDLGVQARRAVVVDAGAGGISVAVLAIGPRAVRLVSAAGDDRAGGDAFDGAIVRRAIEKLGPQGGAAAGDPVRGELLRQRCEEIKRELSDLDATSMPLPFLPPCADGSPPSLAMTRAELQALLGDLLPRTALCCERALRDAGTSKQEIDALLVTGGMAHVPELRRAIELVCGGAKAQLQPAGALAHGAALLAGALSGLDEELLADEGASGGAQSRRTSSRPAAPAPVPSRPAIPAPVPSRPAIPAPVPSRPAASAAAPSRPAALAPAPSRPAALAPAPSAPAAPVPTPPVAAAAAPPAAPAPPGSAPGPAWLESGLALPAEWAGVPPAPRSQPSLPPVPERGTIRNPSDAASLLGLPLSRPPTAAELEPVALAVLLARLLRRRAVTGQLEIKRGERSVELRVLAGRGLIDKRERDSLLDAFGWPEASYLFKAQEPRGMGAESIGLLGLAAEGLRVQLRGLGAEELEKELGELLDLAPSVDHERIGVLRQLGLNQRDMRFVDFALDGSASGRHVVLHGGIARRTALQVLGLLQLFACLRWKPVVVKEDLVGELARRCGRTLRANHFEALGVHWSAGTDDVENAYRRLAEQLAPGGPWSEAAPEACRQMRERAEAAYAVLRDPKARIAYRRKAHPDIDFHAIDDLLDQKAKALAMRQADREAEEETQRREELRASWHGPEPRSRSSRPGARDSEQPSPSTRPPAPSAGPHGTGAGKR